MLSTKFVCWIESHRLLYVKDWFPTAGAWVFDNLPPSALPPLLLPPSVSFEHLLSLSFLMVLNDQLHNCKFPYVPLRRRNNFIDEKPSDGALPCAQIFKRTGSLLRTP